VKIFAICIESYHHSIAKLSRLKKVAFADTAEERRHNGLSQYRKRIDKANVRKMR